MNNHSGRLTLEYHPRLVRPIHLVEVRPPTHAQVDLQQRAHDVLGRRRVGYQDVGPFGRGGRVNDHQTLVFELTPPEVLTVTGVDGAKPRGETV